MISAIGIGVVTVVSLVLMGIAWNQAYHKEH